jgi:outer membrane protein TolC
MSLDKILETAVESRQEILSAALSEGNANTALTLARMEWVPDFSVSYSLNRYAPGSSGVSHDNSASVGINIPIFGWMKQREDVKSAADSLAASVSNAHAVNLQTTANATELYRTLLNALATAQLNRDYLLPLATKNYRVGLLKYESGAIDFSTLSGILGRIYGAQVGYLTAANQFLSAKIALEQMMGGVNSL